ncbi:TonB-dependent receptor [Pedobacter sp. MR2016-19]|uniref:TonB-dependent receptor n=1 Tax=Pedobacter sp. MR2016-19 TaxID=2780089 RepID=UPI0018757FDA|nr:carboxypeptidase regulatory-like domain-containing protein [Pedobacter sp. MR2016-19]MBE5319785.1 TonB-dependent receptor [Pedobacter sp. MR2016-19]
MRTLTILFVLLSSTVFGQSTRTVLYGTIKDGQGMPLSGASITLTHKATAAVYGCASNAAGGYLIPSVLPGGPYELEIRGIGLEKYRRSDLYFKLDEPMLIDVTLKEEILLLNEIKVKAPAVDTLRLQTNNSVGFNINYRKMKLLPTVKRGIADYIRLSPNAFGAAIAGGNFRQNFITIDGSEFNNNFGVGDNLPGNGAQPVSLEAIAEISLNNAPYNAIWESGFIGSAVNIVSRSGTNSTEGALYAYFRGSSSFGNRVGEQFIARRPNQYQLQGARIGGAVVKNRLFYFLSFEKEREVYQPQTFRAATPTAAYGSATDVARPTVAELDEISAYLNNRYGYKTGPYQDYDFQAASYRLLIRFDWNIAKNNTISLRYNQLNSNKPELVNGSRSPLTPFAAGTGRRGINALTFANSNFDTRSNFYSLAAEWDCRFSNVLSHTLRASYTRQYEYRNSDSVPFPFVDILKDGQPFASFGYEPFSLNNKRGVRLASLTDLFHWKPGKNSWDFGIQADYMATDNTYMPFGTGYYTFASWDDFKNGKKPLDYALTYTVDGGDQAVRYAFDYLNFSAFLQHYIRITSHTELNFGLRGDVTVYPKKLPDNQLLGQLSFAEGEKVNTAFLPKPALLLSPRLSFKYDLFGDGNYLLKVGTGIFTGRIPFVWVISQARYSGVGQISQTWKGPSNTPITFDPDPQQASVAKNANVLPSVSSVLAKDFKMPQSWKSSISFDMPLPLEIKGKVELLYNKDIRGISFRDLNLVNPVQLNIPGYPDHRLVYPQENREKFINPLNSSGQRDPMGNKAMNVVSIFNSSGGYYFSAMGNLTKKFANGLDLSFSYIRSVTKTYNDGDGDQTLSALNATPSVNGINNQTLDYAGYVPPGRVVASLAFPLKFFKMCTVNLGLVYQGSSEGRFSYTYGRDLIGDGTNRSLIYIPKDPSEITFSPFSISTANGRIVYSAEEQKNAFFAYIEQDQYLKTRRGTYAERNGGILPWRNQVDLRLSTELGLYQKHKKHVLELSVDILNFCNFINSKWGLRKLPNANALLIPTNLDKVRPSGTAIPLFQLATTGDKLIAETYKNDNSINSTYIVQIGVRYSFL